MSVVNNLPKTLKYLRDKKTKEIVGIQSQFQFGKESKSKTFYITKYKKIEFCIYEAEKWRDEQDQYRRGKRLLQ